MKREIETVGEYLYWSYANLAMAHAALSHEVEKYGRLHYTIRTKLYNGLCNGTMRVGPLADDERLKLVIPQACSYCGSRQHLAVDHLIPRKHGGEDRGDNLVWACRTCNSSKGASDVLEWLGGKGIFPPVLLLRRYLKIVIDYCIVNEIMGHLIADVPLLPFSLLAIPHNYPPPRELCLWIIPLHE
ncbi:MAG TPA: HNH endonuclease [Armatimonadota bacterium]|jgi:hypothetical protein